MLLGQWVTQISIDLPFDKSALRALEESGLTLPASLLKAHPKRQEKYLGGRLCAHLAFIKAGFTPPLEIATAPDGSPLWPVGWTGSITHTDQFASAAVAEVTKVLAIGIDSEALMRAKTHANISERILTGKELQGLCPKGWSEIEWTTFVFSAKESIYKCLRPLCGNFFGFEDAELDEVDDELGQFKFHLKRHIGAAFTNGWQGRGTFAKSAGWIHTAMELQASSIPGLKD